MSNRTERAGRRHPLLWAFSIAAGTVLVGACVDSRGGPIPYSSGHFTAPDPIVPMSLDSSYKISLLDTLEIKVFKMEDLSGEYDVDLTGRISMPLIGDVEAIQLTTSELDQRLTAKLGERYLENPDVSVAIKKSTGRSVTVDGAVREAGSYPVAGRMTLMQAVASAKGTNEEANIRRVGVFRQIDGKRQAAAFDLLSIRRGQEPDPLIYPGDIVVVDGSSIKAAQKQIMNAVPILSIFRPY